MAKKSYRRSTPVIRLRRNLDKMRRHAELVLSRLDSDSWQSTSDDRVMKIAGGVRAVRQTLVELDGVVCALVDSGFAPSRRSTSYHPEVGHHVQVADKCRDKYARVYATIIKQDPELLDDLVVRDVLPTGEIIVQRGQRTPFLVRKSHVRKVGGGEQLKA